MMLANVGLFIPVVISQN